MLMQQFLRRICGDKALELLKCEPKPAPLTVDDSQQTTILVGGPLRDAVKDIAFRDYGSILLGPLRNILFPVEFQPRPFK